MRLYIGRRGRSVIVVVARSSSVRPMHDQGALVGSKIGPSDHNSEAALLSSFPSSFLLLSMSSYPYSWFVIVVYV